MDNLLLVSRYMLLRFGAPVDGATGTISGAVGVTGSTLISGAGGSTSLAFAVSAMIGLGTRRRSRTPTELRIDAEEDLGFLGGCGARGAERDMGSL
mmetsp:Transcript_46739/g.123528  ORF Transcript_46739/g.123528 Transcript_46739/m.123528 type:complete len:96 (-) Transcript_46739:102-389(-)